MAKVDNYGSKGVHDLRLLSQTTCSTVIKQFVGLNNFQKHISLPQWNFAPLLVQSIHTGLMWITINSPTSKKPHICIHSHTYNTWPEPKISLHYFQNILQYIQCFLTCMRFWFYDFYLNHCGFNVLWNSPGEKTITSQKYPLCIKLRKRKSLILKVNRFFDPWGECLRKRNHKLLRLSACFSCVSTKYFYQQK